MAKPKTTWEMRSWGIYTPWDRTSKALPEVKDFTLEVPVRHGIEFGYILEIKKGKGKQIKYTIEHPSFNDSQGNPAPPFTGEVYIRSNDWSFYLGDTVWEPLHDKVGTWRLIAELEGVIMGDKTFELIEDTD